MCPAFEADVIALRAPCDTYSVKPDNGRDHRVATNKLSIKTRDNRDFGAPHGYLMFGTRFRPKKRFGRHRHCSTRGVPPLDPLETIRRDLQRPEVSKPEHRTLYCPYP